MGQVVLNFNHTVHIHVCTLIVHASLRLFTEIYYKIIHMKKLLDCDWLREVQFKCNTSAKSVTPEQITNRNWRL